MIGTTNRNKLVDLASYIVDKADNRGERVEPRRELQLYRFQESRDKELKRAIELVDRALALDPKHVGATMQIGTMWYEFTGDGVMEVTEMDSTKYRTTRHR